MFVSGDVLMTVAIYLSLAATGYAAILAAGLFFEPATARARERVAFGVWRTALIGLLIAATLGTISFAMMAAPPPALKILGMAFMGALLFIAAIGASGLAKLGAERICEAHPNMPHFTARSRSAMLIVGASMMPIIGWLIVAPLVLAVSLGAGWRAVVRRAARAEAAVEAA